SRPMAVRSPLTTSAPPMSSSRSSTPLWPRSPSCSQARASSRTRPETEYRNDEPGPLSSHETVGRLCHCRRGTTMKNRSVKENGLAVRSGWSIFLTELIYAVLILAIWWIVGQSIGGVSIADLVSAGAFFFQWYLSGRITMRDMGGREVSAEEAPELHTIV